MKFRGWCLGKCTKWPQNDWQFWGQKSSYAYHIYPLSPTTVSFTNQRAVFEVPANMSKVCQMTWMISKWPWHFWGQKVPCAYLIFPWGPQCCPFRSTMTCFWVARKSALNDPQITLTCFRLKACICNIPEILLRPKFTHPFRSPVSHSLRELIFFNFPLNTT